MTYLWRECKDDITYRFQTDEKHIVDKMKRRLKFSLIAVGMNCPLWIYQAHFTRPDLARAALKSLTGREIKYIPEEDVYEAEE